MFTCVMWAGGRHGASVIKGGTEKNVCSFSGLGVLGMFWGSIIQTSRVHSIIHNYSLDSNWLKHLPLTTALFVPITCAVAMVAAACLSGCCRSTQQKTNRIPRAYVISGLLAHFQETFSTIVKRHWASHHFMWWRRPTVAIIYLCRQLHSLHSTKPTAHVSQLSNLIQSLLYFCVGLTMKTTFSASMYVCRQCQFNVWSLCDG